MQEQCLAQGVGLTRYTGQWKFPSSLLMQEQLEKSKVSQNFAPHLRNRFDLLPQYPIARESIQKHWPVLPWKPEIAVRATGSRPAPRESNERITAKDA